MAKRVSRAQRDVDSAWEELSEEIRQYVIAKQLSTPRSRDTGIGWMKACLEHAVKLMESLVLPEGMSVPDSARERLYQDVQEYLREKVQSEAK